MRWGLRALLFAFALFAPAAARAEGPSAVGSYETVGAIDGAKFGGRAGLATVRIRLDADHRGEVAIQPADGSAPITRPASWRFDAKKRVLAVKVAGKRIRGEMVEAEGAIQFAGATWRRLDAAAPAPAVDEKEPPAPAPPAPAPPTTAPAPPATAPAPPATAPAKPPAPTPPTTAPAPPATAPAPPATAPARPPAPAPPATAPARPPAPASPATAPARPPTPASPPGTSTRPPVAPPLATAAGAEVGLWATDLAAGARGDAIRGAGHILLLDLRADGRARLAVLEGARVTALRELGRWSGGGAAIDIPLPTGSRRGALRDGRLHWLGMVWRHQ
jgi:hypothetical protein